MSLILKIDQYLTEIWPSQCWVPYFKINILTLSSLAFEKGRKVWGGESIKELTETTCCNLELNLCTYWDHMQKFSFKSQKLSKILRFENLQNLRYRQTWPTKIHVTCLVFKILGSSFCHGFHGLIFWPWLSWQTYRGSSCQTSSWTSP